MTLEYKNESILNALGKYTVAHAISGDGAMGVGVALLLCDNVPGLKKNVRDELHVHPASIPDLIHYRVSNYSVINLVTKQYCYDKPTYKNLELAFGLLAKYCEMHNIDNIAMPKIGCGYDRKEWVKVKSLIDKAFENSNTNVIVYEPEGRW